MNRSLLFILVALSALPAASLHAGVATNQTVTLAWDYPAADVTPDLTFKLYHSTTLETPLAQWPLCTNVVGTNLSFTLPVQAGRHYFYLTAQNWWGESDPSNVASTPPLPRCGTLSIHLGNAKP